MVARGAEAVDSINPKHQALTLFLAPLTPMDDQILGGALMKLGGMAVTLKAFAWSFMSWSREERRPAITSRPNTKDPSRGASLPSDLGTKP